MGILFQDYAEGSDPAMPGEPDADSIKLFVGQIPKEISKEELTSIFEAFGPIYQIVKVKDRNTQEYKGKEFIEMTDSCNFDSFL